MPSDKKDWLALTEAMKQDLREQIFYGDSMLGQLALDKLHCSPQLAWAAVQVCSSSADAAMTSQRFQTVDGCALVGQVC